MKKEIKIKCPCCNEDLILLIDNNVELEVSSNESIELSEQELSEKYGIEFG